MITADELRARLSYDPLTGVFRWKKIVGRPNGVRVGSVAGFGTGVQQRYRTIEIDGRAYPAHRLAWLYVHGTLPALIDHKDGNPSNNRMENLRAATRSQNGANSAVSKLNTSGIKGVWWEKNCKKWRARITVQRKRISVGLFDTKEEAAIAIAHAYREHFGEFARAA